MWKLGLKVISYISLVLVLIPSLLVFTNNIDLDTNKILMLLGTLFWFGTRPFWTSKNKQEV